MGIKVLDDKSKFIIPPKETWKKELHFLGYPIYEFVVTNLRQEDTDELYHVLTVMDWTVLNILESQWKVKDGKLTIRVANPKEMRESERKFVGR